MNSIPKHPFHLFGFRECTVWSDDLYWSIRNNNLPLFEKVATANTHNKYLQEIIVKDRRAHAIHLHKIGFLFEELHLSHAITLGNLEMVKIIDPFVANVSPYLIEMTVAHGNITMMKFIYEKHREIFAALSRKEVGKYVVTLAVLKQDEEMLKFILDQKCYTDSTIVDRIIDQGDHYNIDVSRIVCILHDYRVKYDWGCKEGRCKYCNERAENIIDNWVLESYDYSSYIQWMPRELVEDLLDIL